ncbi:MAG: exonuclease domain-containing protein [Candidatus Rokuibacteriota bacterium]
MTTRVAMGETPFAVVDLETTGIYPGGHDRIIEIAVVKTTPGLEVVDEWTSLINPGRDIGRTDVHGIRAGDVAQAPTFAEIAADVGELLRDAVIVAHNLRFDLRFLEAEYSRCRLDWPELPGLCTLDLAFRLLPDAPSRKLAYCCSQAGILQEDEHEALGDARATAQLLARFVEMARDRRLTTLEALGCEPLTLPAAHWLAGATRTGKRLARDRAAALGREERSYLSQLVQGMPGDEGRSPREAEYLALVDRAIEDRRVKKAEADHLARMAASWGMTRSDVLEAHRAYLASLASEALSDRQVTDAEHRDLLEVCDLLGLHQTTLDVLLTIAQPSKERTTAAPRPGADLRGQSVCFTGELLGALKGERITRDIAEKLASAAGLEVRASVTKKLELLVVADPDTQSIKAKKAREYGVRIIAEAAFWRALGVPVE